MAAKSILSVDARVVGSLFALMQPGRGKLLFGMLESRPTERTQKALDELVEQGFLSIARNKRNPSVEYHLLQKIPEISRAQLKKNTFRFMEDIPK